MIGNAADGAAWSFNVYPRSRSRLHCRVCVFRTRREMRQAVLALNALPKHATDWKDTTVRDAKRLVGHCVGVTMRRVYTGSILPRFAEIYVARQDLCMGTITHECVHAAMRLASRLGVEGVPTSRQVGVVTSDEEWLARDVDAMASQVVVRARKLGLLGGS